MSEQGGRYWIKDIIRVQEEAAEVERIIQQAAGLDGKETKIYMEQEGGASGKSLISYYARNILKGYTFKGVSPTGSKPVRAQPLAAAVANGNVYLIAAAWNSSFLDEAERFPTAKVHDDQCDSASQAFNLLNDKKKHPVLYPGRH
jgi:predicted phage terminase large subunit-like protein